MLSCYPLFPFSCKFIKSKQELDKFPYLNLVQSVFCYQLCSWNQPLFYLFHPFWPFTKILFLLGIWDTTPSGSQSFHLFLHNCFLWTLPNLKYWHGPEFGIWPPFSFSLYTFSLGNAIYFLFLYFSPLVLNHIIFLALTSPASTLSLTYPKLNSWFPHGNTIFLPPLISFPFSLKNFP